MGADTLMTAIQIIYGTAPYCLWLAIAGGLIAVAAALGARQPMWPATAALVVAVASAATGGLGPAVEAALFVALAAAITGVCLRKGASSPKVEPAEPRRQAEPASPRIDAPARLVGRIARASAGFANGVGRVSIDGMEWTAELDGDEIPASGQAVRVTKVIGGVRLQVHAVAA